MDINYIYEHVDAKIYLVYCKYFPVYSNSFTV